MKYKTSKTTDAPRDSSRPYRLWDVTKRREMRWRYYGDKRRAHNAALIEARWLEVGHTVEVYDARTGKMLGQYTRKLNTVSFMGA